MTINEMIREMKEKGFTYQVISTIVEEEIQKTYVHINAHGMGLSPQRIGKIASIKDRECNTTTDIRMAIKKAYRRLCK